MADKRYPPSSYGAKYPYNRHQVTESGHEFSLDDTPGAERVRLAHRSGSHFEYSANGRSTYVSVAGVSRYVKGGVTSTVDGNVDEKVGGSQRSSVHGDTHTEVAGAVTSMVQGDASHVVGGHHTQAVGGDSVQGVGGKAVYKFGGGVQLKFDGASSDHNTVNAIADVAAKLEFGKTLEVTAKEGILFKSDVSITFQVGDSVYKMTPGGIKLLAPRNVIEATQTNIITSAGGNMVTSEDGTKVESAIFPPVGKTIADV